jgi:hypothetical protein
VQRKTGYVRVTTVFMSRLEEIKEKRDYNLLTWKGCDKKCEERRREREWWWWCCGDAILILISFESAVSCCFLLFGARFVIYGKSGE